MITDAWENIELFIEPECEVNVVQDGYELAKQLRMLTPTRASAIGAAARRRMLAEHTYRLRAEHLAAELQPPYGYASMGYAPRVVMLGLSITSSWGNGHATTYRSLVRALAARGHAVLFLEGDVPWYAAHRDLHAIPSALIALYSSLQEL